MSGTGNSTEVMDPNQSRVDYTSLAGSLVMALALNWGMQGMLCLQVYTYYLAFPKDRLQAKIQVYGVLLFELFQSAIVAHDVFVALTSGGFHGHFSRELDSLQTSWLTIPVAGGITGGVGQLFFAYRIWLISNEKAPTFVIAILSVASICAALISASSFFHAKTFSILLSATDGFGPITAWNGIGAICDISIFLSMPYFLMRHGTGLPSTHTLIVRLVRLIIETGGLTAIFAVTHLCLYVSHIEIFVVPGLAMSKIYATTMLVIFNNRVKIAGGRFDQEEELDDTTGSMISRERRNSRTKIFVSNGRLTFRLPTDIPSSPTTIENRPSSSSSEKKAEPEP